MKKVTYLLLVLLVVSLSGCFIQGDFQQEDSIECFGLDNLIVDYGGEVDLMTDVFCLSMANGNATDSIYTTGEVDSSVLGVVLVHYNVPYEDTSLGEYVAVRRVIVRHPSVNFTPNLVENGDWDAFDTFGFSEHIDFDAEIRYLLDPDLRRLQVLITSVPESDQWPQMYSNMMELNSTKTYEVSMLVSGTEATAFGIDIVELDTFNVVTKTIMAKQQVDVPIQGDDMTLYTFQFTPTENTTTGCLRFVFGSTPSFTPSGHIFIDNVSIEEVN